MKLMNYANKHALVLGLGESGLAMARWLVHCGARVRVADTRDAATLTERLDALRAAAPEAGFVGGQPLDAGLLAEIDFVAVSPGLFPERDLGLLANAAAEKGIPLWGEIELFAQALAALRDEQAYMPKVLAITGTNGKTTVTSLTGMLCQRAGLSVKVAGNISPAALDVLREALIEDQAYAVVRAEQDALEAAQAAETLAAETAAAAELQAQVAAEEQAVAEAAAKTQALAITPDTASTSVLPETSETASTETIEDIAQADAPIAPAAEPVADEHEVATAALAEPSPEQPDVETVVAEADADITEALPESEFDDEPEAVPAPLDDDAPLTFVPPPPPAPPAKIYRGILPQVWVLELSSFQLHATYSLQADAATVLNVTQDHLDWHGSMEAYAADKARIFGERTVRVLNRDDPLVMQMAAPDAVLSSFGLAAPAKANSFGLYDENGMLWLANAVVQEDDEKPEGKRRSKKDQKPVELPVVVKRLMPVDALRIRGLHNALNALAALALCRAIDLPLAPLLHGLREYTGEPHRVELITTIQDVEYYDDSKGTNVGATVAALNGLGHGGKPNRLLLIAGGDGKGQDFSPLAEPLSKYGRAVFLIGRDAPAIRAAVADTGIDLIDCTTLEEAVEKAGQMAQPGEAVLLSPACASLDMFRNYAHRAQVFVDAVRELALSRGEVVA